MAGERLKTAPRGYEKDHPRIELLRMRTVLGMRSYGFEPDAKELPDYLPALLEFLAHIDTAHAQKLLGDAVHVIEHIRVKLAKNHSPYAAVLAAAVALSPVTPQPLIEPPVRDMDEAMETFGPDVSGIEPLLKPAIDTIQFYPKSDFQAACKGASA